MQRFDHFQEARANESKPKVQSNGGHVKAESISSRPSKRPSPDDHDDDTDAPSEKAGKKSEDADAAYAARLQAELNNADRPTRGGGPRKSKSNSTAKRTPKKKSSARIKSDDDSDIGSGSDVEDKPKRTGAFHVSHSYRLRHIQGLTDWSKKPMGLSEPLQRLTGETQLSRPQTVKKIWEYVKSHELQNPEDRRQIMCDDMLQAIFKQSSVSMFSMNKILSKNLYPIDE